MARALLARGDRVTGVRRSAGSAEQLRAAGIEPIQADLSDAGSLALLPPGLEALVVCPSAGGDQEANYRRAYIDVNRNLLDATRKMRILSYVYTGSTGVFGQTDGSEVDEGTRPCPASRSAEILVEAESLVLDAARHGLRTSVVRLSGLYGPGRAWPIVAFRSGSLALGSGDDRYVNWCHRDDAAAAVVAALDRGRPGAIYHATDAHPAKKREVVEWLAARLAVPAPRATGSTPGRRGATNRRIQGVRTRSELGLELMYPSFREGLEALLTSDAEMH